MIRLHLLRIIIEEYLAIQPLTDYEILASLTSVLKDTAKDWWVPEKRNVQTWEQFKVFLRSFLNDDYEDETARSLLEGKQRCTRKHKRFCLSSQSPVFKMEKGYERKGDLAVHS